ncbi:uncharacterized protein RSE6_08668 [Rhynchosporium secalis]|uniref:Uncharacterized protein n=1 Tax=Rhynchosporium secalis TaxID=38038 RepID=A0A1E1MFZ7_RHYSE|nr:uncharacterized protein RSE6_08668 [Rhynchosporium secalis]
MNCTIVQFKTRRARFQLHFPTGSRVPTANPNPNPNHDTASLLLDYNALPALLRHDELHTSHESSLACKCQYTPKDIRGFQLPASGASFPDSPLHAISAVEPSRQKLKVKLKFSARTSSVRRYLVFRDKTRGAVEKIPQAPTLLR